LNPQRKLWEKKKESPSRAIKTHLRGVGEEVLLVQIHNRSHPKDIESSNTSHSWFHCFIYHIQILLATSNLYRWFVQPKKSLCFQPPTTTSTFICYHHYFKFVHIGHVCLLLLKNLFVCFIYTSIVHNLLMGSFSSLDKNI